MHTTSISRRLLIGLALVVGATIAIVGMLFTISVERSEDAELKRNIQTSVAEASQLLETSLWDLDLDRAERLGEAFAQDPRVVRLTIREATTGEARVVRRPVPGETVSAQRTISHRGQIVGEVELTFSRLLYDRRVVQQVRTAFAIGLVTLIVSLLGVRLLVRRVLRRPLRELSAIVNDYAAGIYSPAKKPIGYREFQAFSDVLDAMGTRVTSQLEARKQAEETAWRSRNMLVQVMNTVPQAVFWKDRDGVFLGCNTVFASAMGFSSPDDVIGKTDFDMPVPRTFAEAYRALDREVIDSRQPRKHVVERFERPDGKEMWVDTTKIPLLDDNGGLLGLLGVAEDVTERTLSEQALRHSQRLEAVGQLAGGVAHDFNNILGAIVMQLELLDIEQRVPPELASPLRDVRTSVDRAANLTRQLLMFSRRQAMRVQPHDLNVVVGDLLRMLTRVIGESINVQFDRASNPVPVEGDSGMIEQVVMNLCVNARDAMPDGGRLSIRTSIVTLHEADVATRPNARAGRFACLEVTDTGMGMSAETQQHIFEPFFTTKPVGKGTGLGLATSHGIVAQHDGWIELTSEVGEGTTFCVFFPALVAAPDQRPLASVEARGGTATVLLVEDETHLRRMISRSLQKLGYMVIEAPNGPAALRIWEARHADVDVLLTDMVMPEGLNGIALGAQLRLMEPDLAVVVMSGYSVDLMGDVESRTDDVQFLTKPFTIAALADAMTAAVGERR